MNQELKKIYTYRLNPLWERNNVIQVVNAAKYLIDDINPEYVKTMWKFLEYDWTGEDITKIKGTDIESREWKDIARDLTFYFNLTEDFIYRYRDHFNWNTVCTYQTLSEKFIEEMKDYVIWSTILENQILSENWIRKNMNWFKHAHWYHLTLNRKIRLSDDIIRECADELEWTHLSTYYHFSKEFIREMNKRIWYNHFSYNAKKDFNDKLKKEFLLPDEDTANSKNYKMLKDVIYR